MGGAGWKVLRRRTAFVGESLEFMGGALFGMRRVDDGGRNQTSCVRGLWRAGRAGGFRGGWAEKRARVGRSRAAMDSRKLSELRAFVRLCKQNPGLLHTPELAFLREWVERSVPGRGRRRPGGGRGKRCSGAGRGEGRKGGFPQRVRTRGRVSWPG